MNVAEEIKAKKKLLVGCRMEKHQTIEHVFPSPTSPSWKAP